MAHLILTVDYEGGCYSPDKNPDAPIRIYSDRRVADDIARRLGGKRWRQTLSRKEYRRARKAAAKNRRLGYV